MFKMNKTISIILLISLLLTITLSFSPSIFAATDVPYLDENGDMQICPSSVELTGGSAITLNTGWYLASGTCNFTNTISIVGDAHIIIEDGCDVTVNGNNYNAGINLQNPNSLTIYAQSDGISMGKINVTGKEGSAGIGGGINGNNGTIIINGGIVTSKGGPMGAGFGGGSGGNSGIVIINGGIVNAIGNSGAGIGGGGGPGSRCSGGVITINGGTVNATGDGGAGIGGGIGAPGGKITINGGTINANGGNGAGIGSGIGPNDADGEVTINGGSVIATSDNGAGIGGGSYSFGGIVNINGGIINTISNNGAGIGDGYSPAPIGEPGTLSLPENGNGIIFTSSISDTATANKLGGILFDDARGSDAFFYGDEITPTDDFTIPEGKTLTVPDGAVLNISEEITLTNEGTVTNEGILINNGTVIDNGTLINKNILISEEKISAVYNDAEDEIDIIGFYNENDLLLNVFLTTESEDVSNFDIPSEIYKISVMKWKFINNLSPLYPAVNIIRNIGGWSVEK